MMQEPYNIVQGCSDIRALGGERQHNPHRGGSEGLGNQKSQILAVEETGRHCKQLPQLCHFDPVFSILKQLFIHSGRSEHSRSILPEVPEYVRNAERWPDADI